jgi:hypothetical protein
MARNISEEEEIRKSERRLAALEQQIKTDVMLLLQKPEGQRLFAYLLALFNPLKPSFDMNGSVMSRKEGRREAGIEIYSLMKMANENVAIEIMHSLDKKEKDDV